MGRPLISMRASGRISGPSSIGRPRPSKTRPSISSDTPSSMLRPRKRTLLLDRLIPVELSKSCTSTSLPFTSSTLHRLVSPLASSISPSSSYVTPSTPRTSISGPATSCMLPVWFCTLLAFSGPPLQMHWRSERSAPRLLSYIPRQVHPHAHI